jgi:hypothetical protein
MFWCRSGSTISPSISEACEVRYCLSYRQLVISSIIGFGIVATLLSLLPGSRGISKWMLLPVLWFFVTVANLYDWDFSVRKLHKPRRGERAARCETTVSVILKANRRPVPANC